ncbi:Uu.00g093500.m01.CDS01 [Anthostomella pinea]|uniref:t-SNARE affecting a late Golgi compartment protein 1 n=1 Tax=Anthostomella pinea TaxID=933095 RepID=A0AAI8VNI6_9PEZI|nr:Uu.00g093500.m01.CDS01 [Anthostomella pinea]
MSSTNEEDPFLQVQQDVLSQMQTARPLFASYLRIRSLHNTTTTSNSPELSSARSDLESALTTLAEDLADLVESVRAVESDPAAFGLSAHEVARRKRLVQEVGGEVEDMREELHKQTAATSSAAAKAAAAKAAANGDLPHPSAFAIDSHSGPGIPGEEDGDNYGNDNYAEFEQQQQLAQMRDQDEALDGVFVTVGNLRRQADVMGRELEEQREMLEEVDTLADRVGGRLQTGVRKLAYVARKNEDRWSGCCVALLIAVLIILLVLLLVL